jgi:hypothetical protein
MNAGTIIPNTKRTERLYTKPPGSSSGLKREKRQSVTHLHFMTNCLGIYYRLFFPFMCIGADMKGEKIVSILLDLKAYIFQLIVRDKLKYIDTEIKIL